MLMYFLGLVLTLLTIRLIVVFVLRLRLQVDSQRPLVPLLILALAREYIYFILVIDFIFF